MDVVKSIQNGKQKTISVRRLRERCKIHMKLTLKTDAVCEQENPENHKSGIDTTRKREGCIRCMAYAYEIIYPKLIPHSSLAIYCHKSP